VFAFLDSLAQGTRAFCRQGGRSSKSHRFCGCGGAHQKVVTVEVGPENARVWLTVGVGTNGITCLHTTVAPEVIHDYEGPSTVPGAPG